MTAGAVLIAPVGALADGPKPYRVTMPYGACGLPDTVTRAVVRKMAVVTGTTFVVENKPGAHANIGGAYVAHASAVGHVLPASGSYIPTSPQI